MDANNRQRQNRELLIHNRKRIARIREMYLNSPHNPNRGGKMAEIPPEALAKIRAGIKVQLAKERIRQRTIGIIIFSLAVLTGVGLMAMLTIRI